MQPSSTAILPRGFHLERPTNVPFVARHAWLLSAAALIAAALSTSPAAAQFSAREGFTPDGTAHWSFEVTPYVFLPNVDAKIGLAHPPGTDVSVNQSRPTLADVVGHLTGAFVADSLVRYGNWSGELNVFYVGLETKTNLPSVLPGGPGATLKNTLSATFISPGFGYQVLPTDATSKLALDVRAGFSYDSVSASSQFEQSLFGGTSHSSSFVQPWIGARLSYYPSPKWRVVAAGALTGLGVDGGAIGWNSRLTLSYLVTNWLDVTLGYSAIQTRREGKSDRNGENRSIKLLAYGPVAAVGFRF
jgi:hypothetical protein